MDGLIILCLAVFLCFKNSEEDIVVVDRKTAINTSLYHDENAFMEVANALVHASKSVRNDSSTATRMWDNDVVPPDTTRDVHTKSDRDGNKVEDLVRSRISR